MLDRVAAVLNFNALRNKAFAAFLTTAAENITACFGGHPSTETKLLFASALGGLICSFTHGDGALTKMLCRLSVPNHHSGRGLYGSAAVCQSANVWNLKKNLLRAVFLLLKYVYTTSRSSPLQDRFGCAKELARDDDSHPA